ncbi:MAG TPA: SUMF1/EgtB/PvdO family nonheme iron enzyme [Blastocatellia bacterium]|nr:SUMF1/EgtB/PvdO family nonheme iron enzyme [Blastocatellia bacterium]
MSNKAVPPTEPLIGKVLAGRYRILEKLGEGGMGAVYKAVQTEMDRICAIKLLTAVSADKAAALARFKREARMSSRIDNPHAITIYDFGEAEGGMLYLVMEFVKGQSLSRIFSKEKTLPLNRVVNITRQIAEGLAAAHAIGIVHRDLKPDNVMLTEKGGESDYVKVLDFGIAKTMTNDGEEHLTQTGYVLGTPVYMSPEQLSGEKLDARSDIYSLAIMVYEMLSGRLPFEGDNPQAIMIKRVMADPIPLRMVAPAISDSVERVVMMGLARNREERIQTVTGFAQELARAAQIATNELSGRPTSAMGNEGGAVSTVQFSSPQSQPADDPQAEGKTALYNSPPASSAPPESSPTLKAGRPTMAESAPPGTLELPQPPQPGPAPVTPAPTREQSVSPPVVSEPTRRRGPGVIALAGGAAVALAVAVAAYFLVLASSGSATGFALVVQGAPPGSQVFINDALRGTIAADGTLKVADLTPGDVNVRVAHDGYADFSATVSGKEKEEKTVAATLLPLEIDFNGQMVLIPAGEFIMGSNSHENDEKPERVITLPAYYIDKYEVTNAQYKRFCQETGRKPPPNPKWDPDYFEGQPDAPVIGITRDEAIAYANWAKKRLPTEEEWEKAASWDPVAKKKRQWPWGDEADLQRANLKAGPGHPVPVTQFSTDRSAYGVFGMAGNAYEWVNSYYDAYPGNTKREPEFGKTYSVVRGGAFPLSLDAARTTYRNNLPAVFSGPMTTPVGFRCVVSADTPELKNFLDKNGK